MAPHNTKHKTHNTQHSHNTQTNAVLALSEPHERHARLTIREKSKQGNAGMFSLFTWPDCGHDKDAPPEADDSQCQPADSLLSVAGQRGAAGAGGRGGQACEVRAKAATAGGGAAAVQTCFSGLGDQQMPRHRCQHMLAPSSNGKRQCDGCVAAIAVIVVQHELQCDGCGAAAAPPTKDLQTITNSCSVPAVLKATAVSQAHCRQ